MSKLIKFIADGKEIEAKEGDILLQVLLDEGISVPHFCYHEALGVDGNCRMCMVEIEGSKRPQISCDTLIKEGMVIKTKGGNIDEVKRSILELELINHPVDCPICDQAGECKLQDYYMEVGLYDSILTTPKVHKKKHVNLGSNVMLDQERCVLCQRCTRFTQNVTKTGELGIMGRGDHSYVGVMPGRELNNPYAMNVVDLCPVGALTSKDFRFKQRVWFLKPVTSICQGCAKGCNILVDHNQEKYKDDVVYRFRPRLNKNVNGHFICDTGRLSFHNENENRALFSTINNKETTPNNAINAFKSLLEKHNKQISFLISPSTSLEDAYAIQKLADKYGAKLFCDHKSYIDGEDDDLLIRADKASNLAGMKSLSIDTAEFGECELLININHKHIVSHKNLVELHTHNRDSKTILSLAIASYTEQFGSIINCDGYLQKMNQVVDKKTPQPTIMEIVGDILGENIDIESIWKSLSNIQALQGLNFYQINALGTKVEV
jgi:NADH-quinone oxidoreductase subunit G